MPLSACGHDAMQPQAACMCRAWRLHLSVCLVPAASGACSPAAQTEPVAVQVAHGAQLALTWWTCSGEQLSPTCSLGCSVAVSAAAAAAAASSSLTAFCRQGFKATRLHIILAISCQSTLLGCVTLFISWQSRLAVVDLTCTGANLPGCLSRFVLDAEVQSISASFQTIYPQRPVRLRRPTMLQMAYGVGGKHAWQAMHLGPIFLARHLGIWASMLLVDVAKLPQLLLLLWLHGAAACYLGLQGHHMELRELDALQPHRICSCCPCCVYAQMLQRFTTFCRRVRLSALRHRA